MAEAHQLEITTSATMMFGHVETLQERFEHLIKIREVQKQEASACQGFSGIYSLDFSRCRYFIS
jgi:cyclic dehypoxanthinyl futalosine synthase